MSIAVVEESSNATGQLFAVEVLDSEARSGQLRAHGTLTGRGAEMLEAMLTTQQERGVRYVRVDVSAVKAADPVGLAGLLSAHRRFLAERGTLVLTGVSSELHRALADAGLDDVLLTVDPPRVPNAVAADSSTGAGDRRLGRAAAVSGRARSARPAQQAHT